MSMPETNLKLCGTPKAKTSIPNNLSSSSALALSSELARLVADGSTQSRKRPAQSSKSDLFGKGSKNKGVSQRAAKDIADGISARKTTSKDIGYLDDAQLERARKKMEEKTRLYNAMKRGDYVPPTKKLKGGWAGAEEERAGALIDFDRKWAERKSERDRGSDSEEGSSSDEDDRLSDRSDDEEMVDHEDEFGRTKKMTKRELRKLEREEGRGRRIDGAGGYDSDEEDVRKRRIDPTKVIYGDVIQTAAFDRDAFEMRQKQREEEEREEQNVHYDATKEVRTKGVGFYQFSQDNDARKKEMDALADMREKTLRERKEKENKKEERRKEVERRREELKRRRQGKEGERWLQNFLDETPNLFEKTKDGD